MNPALGVYAALPDLLDYMIWGDTLVMDAAAQVPEAEYMADRGISAGSLHLLLLHAMGAQAVWLARFHMSPIKFPMPADFPTREVLFTRWKQVHVDLQAFLAQQTPETLAASITFKNFQGQEFSHPLGQLFMHVTDHGTYHRGQQNTLLKLAGGTPTRAWYYLWSSEFLPAAPSA